MEDLKGVGVVWVSVAWVTEGCEPVQVRVRFVNDDADSVSCCCRLIRRPQPERPKEKLERASRNQSPKLQLVKVVSARLLLTMPMRQWRMVNLLRLLRRRLGARRKRIAAKPELLVSTRRSSLVCHFIGCTANRCRTIPSFTRLGFCRFSEEFVETWVKRFRTSGVI